MSAKETARVDALKELAAFAIDVAMQAPEKPSKRRVYIRRETIEGIRKACERHGIDWRSHKREREVTGF